MPPRVREASQPPDGIDGTNPTEGGAVSSFLLGLLLRPEIPKGVCDSWTPPRGFFPRFSDVHKARRTPVGSRHASKDLGLVGAHVESREDVVGVEDSGLVPL